MDFKRGIPSKMQIFFENLEELISKLFPEDYKNIREKISAIELNESFKIDWPTLE